MAGIAPPWSIRRWESAMPNLGKLLRKLALDESAAEIFEYALVAGLIIIAVLALIGSLVARSWAAEPNRQSL